MSVVFTFPGKIGDALLQWPVAFHWAQQTGQKFACWMDRKSLAPLKGLFESEPCVEEARMIDGIESYLCGGQPWHFGLESKDFDGHRVYHLGMRRFPVRQITLQTAEDSKVPLTDPDWSAPTLLTDVPLGEKKNRLVLHGQAVYAHTKTSPSFWRFIADRREELKTLFETIAFVGSGRDRAAAETSGLAEIFGAELFDDGGDFYRLADFIRDSRCMIGCGSSIVALAGQLKIPAIRVHDPIGQHPKVIWSNLGDNQLNATEEELRSMWPEFRDQWLKEGVTA